MAVQTRKSQLIDILVVDDELPARKKLRSFLEDETGIGEVYEAENGIEAVRLIHEKRPGLVFLDIQMPGMTGFEVIREVAAEQMPVVVFVTAYDQYAIDAFEVQAVDYLLKPYHQERFRTSFQRAAERVRVSSGGLGSDTGAGGDKGNVEAVKELLKVMNREREFLSRVMVKQGDRYFFVSVGDIMYISSEEKYIRLHVGEGSYLLRESMVKMEGRLDPSVFVRIHRSYIVNIEFIKEIQPWTHGDYVVIMQDGNKLNLSRRFSDRLLNR